MDFLIDYSPAVKALGPLFKLTEVYLWDGGSSAERESLYSQEPNKLADGDKDYEAYDGINGFSSMAEVVELAKELNDLGLPLSFQTNKGRHGMTSGKRKGTRKKNQPSAIGIDACMPNSTKKSEEESPSLASLLNTSKMLDQCQILKNGIVADVDGLSNLSLKWSDSMSSTACTSTLGNGHDYNVEVSDLGFDHSLSHSCGSGKNILDEAKTVPSKNEIMATGLDGATSGESCLINEDADYNGKEIKGGLGSVQPDSILMTDHDIESLSNDISFQLIQDSDVAAFAQSSEQSDSNFIDKHQTAKCGEWIAYWDEVYMRNYFYNVKTKESRWDPPSRMEHLVYGNTNSPLGMEHLACGNIAGEPTNSVNGMAELINDHMDFRKSDEVQASSDLQADLHFGKESRNDNGSLNQLFDEIAGNWLSADNVLSTNPTKRKKKKVKRTKSRRTLPNSSKDLQGVLQEVPTSINKYWYQRYLLFSRFDYGIKMDEEGWFSVTPEPIAKHHADRCGNGAVVDFFTGVGGNAIQFAERSKHVIAIDIDPNKVDYARHNAAIYGVDDNIDFIKGDSFSLAPKLKADTVFMSPPWGGPAYAKVEKFDINTMLKPHDGQFLFDAGKGIAPQIVMFLPRNVEINQLAELALSAAPPWSLEVERNILNGRLKAITAYFSEPSMS